MDRGALILDGHLKSALSAVRSLGKHGVRVICGAERGSAMALHSKYAHEVFVYASPKLKPDQFTADIKNATQKIFGSTGEKPIVFAFSDATALLLSRHRGELEPFCTLPMPADEAIEIAADKKRTYEFAKEHLVPTIRTYTTNEYDLVAYPAVVKNRHSIVWSKGKSTSASGSATFVFDRKGLENALAMITEEAGESPLVQEFVQGDEYGIEMVCRKGKPVALFAHKRIRSLSPRGGAAVVKETAHPSPEVAQMEAYARTLCAVLAWEGPVMVEFKIDARSGQVLLMEINGRFWGSLPLAIHAGVDFPYLTYKLAQNDMADFVSRPYRFVRSRHFLGDCKWLWNVMFVHDPMRKMLYPSRMRALWDFKTEILKSSGDIFELRDPLPAIYEYADIIEKWRSKA